MAMLVANGFGNGRGIENRRIAEDHGTHPARRMDPASSRPMFLCGTCIFLCFRWLGFRAIANQLVFQGTKMREPRDF